MSENSILLGPDKNGNRLLTQGDQIVFFGPGEVDAPGAKLIPCADAEIKPAWACAHTHLYSGLVPFGMPAPSKKPENFVQILERVWWRLDRALDAESLRASARYYVAESLLAGCTALVDHHESPNFIEGSLDVLADACDELGVRALLTYGATDRNFGRDEGHRGLEECRRFIESNTRPLVRGVVGLHASFTVSDDTIREAAVMCMQLDVPLHVHVAEDAADVADARKRGYEGPMQRLAELAALPEMSILAHGIHMQPEEVRLADQMGVWFVQNPRSNNGNAVGYPRALQFAQRVALGTDGWAAKMAEEKAFLAEQNLAHGEDPAVATARAESSWRLLSDFFDEPIGALVETAAADVRVENAQGVQHVLVAGRLVVENGRLLTGDIEEIRADARRQAERLWVEMAKYPES